MTPWVLGPEGCVPSTLVFGEYPAPIVSGVKRARKVTIEDRSKIAETARKEMERHMATLKLKRAFKHNVPPAADIPFDVGDKVLVWREKIVNNLIGEWVGPFTVESFDLRRRFVHVRDVQVGPAKPFGFAQVKNYLSAESTTESLFAELQDILSAFRSTDDESDIHLTEILQSDDPRTRSAEMSEAKRREIKGLLDRGTFKIILREDIPTDGNVLPGRFVLAVKSTEDEEVKFKARYVIGGHRDKLKGFMVHTSQTLQPSSVRLLLALAELHGFSTWTSDVTQAYLQSAVPLMRDVFIKDPVPEFELNPNQSLQLLRPLYGLCESGDLWFKTLDDHHKNDLEMKPMRSDPAFYMSMKNNLLEGMSGTYVDDILPSGNANFRDLAKKTSTRFEMAEDSSLPCQFVGFRLQRGKNGTLELNQEEYVRKLRPMPTDGSYSGFASLRMKLAWLAHSRPDCMFEVSQMTQVTRERFEEDRRKLLSA